MSSNRERLEAAGLLAVFERARDAQNVEAMTQILMRAKFTPLEIESIIWSKGDVGHAPTLEEKKQRVWDAVIGRIGAAIVSGVILGGVFAYASSGLNRTDRRGQTKMDVAMSDYRSPEEAYYRPFVWGFVIGSIGGLVTGTLIYDTTSKKG